VAEDWTRSEVEAIVDDYLTMLSLELQDRPYSKTDHRLRLKPLLKQRTDGSIERKHQNISAVLIEVGFPYVSGYKPLRNYQQLLFDVVTDRLAQNHSLKPLAEVEATKLADALKPPLNLLSLLVEPPLPSDKGMARAPTAEYTVRARIGVDYLALEARNRSLGQAGEQLVIEFEIARLRQLGKLKLAKRIELVSATRGDGAGFDVLSFEASGRERFIEVKTTAFGKETPFYLTRNELRFSIDHKTEFHLYRLFQFRRDPRLFSLSGRLDQTCLLDPTQYLARTA